MSRCILGDRVRYDGEIKHYPELNQWLAQHCHTLAVCPEVEMGLSVPRPPLHLVQTANGIQMRGRDDPELDVSAVMQQYCQQRPPQLGAIHGYIFKSRSPVAALRIFRYLINRTKPSVRVVGCLSARCYSITRHCR